MMTPAEERQVKEIGYALFWGAAFLVSFGVRLYKVGMDPAKEAGRDADKANEELRQRW